MRLFKVMLTAGLLAAFATVLAGPNDTVPELIASSDDGVIVFMDHAGRQMTLASAECGLRMVYHWNEATRFMRRGIIASATEFEPGMEVFVYYRTNSGRSVLREVVWKKDSIFVAIPTPEITCAE